MRLSSVPMRIVLALVAAFAGVTLLIYGDRSIQDYFRRNMQTRQQLQSLQTSLYALESELLRNEASLYYSYDRINQLITQIEETSDVLARSPHLKMHYYKATRKALKAFQWSFAQYSQNVLHYLTVNASLKNSAVYIPTLQLRAFKIFDTQKKSDQEALLLISQISATLFLARSAQDGDFLSSIRDYSRKLEKMTSKFQGPKHRLLVTLKSHLDQFSKVFPDYVRYLDLLLQKNLIHVSHQLINAYQMESATELNLVNKTAHLLLILYLLSLVVVIYFILKTSRENLHLRHLKSRLEQALITDPLTGLNNRLAYRKTKEQTPRPSLILINIDRFKHINEFYGTRAGDRVLKEVASLLIRLTPVTWNASLYRMGGDDFGILFSQNDAPLSLEEMVGHYHRNLQHCEIVLEDLHIHLNFAIGASDKSDWLFETADMALKSAKTSQRRRFVIYTPDLDNRLEIAKNLHALQNIRYALTHDHLLPYFQPIYSPNEQCIVKLEALARIEFDDGKTLLPPHSFIQAANEAKLSGEITLRILQKTLQIARSCSYHFSVNLSAEDISNEEDRNQILDLLQEHRSLCPRITFEILESEEIRDYELISEFIRQVKEMGCQIAIDDFGSGYSNFEKILLMDIDLLKVDGSLIRRIDRDSHSELVVRTILDFARHAGWKTVAEFVHSREVYDKAVELGFDYIQGYYIGEPSREIGWEFDPCRDTPPSDASEK